MTYDLIVIGAGLTGLFAGTLAAQRGLRPLVIARGIGATHIGSGCIDVLGYTANGEPLTAPAIDDLIAAQPDHPYSLTGKAALSASLEAFKGICASAGYSMAGSLEANYLLPTAVGAARPTCLAPETMTAGDLRQPDDMTLVTFPGMRDFYPEFAAENLKAVAPNVRAHARTLPLPGAPARRDTYATDLARLFDDPDYRAKAAREWKRELSGAARIGFPAVLGLKPARIVHRDMADRLGAEIFEIPILPPSVPGMRLFEALKTALADAGGRLILGPQIVGLAEKGRVTGVAAQAAGGRREYRADAVLLANGGFQHGGLVGEQGGRARETVFDLPVEAPSSRADWFVPEFFGAHPFMRFGVRVDEHMQPVDASGERIYQNLFAAGSLLAGADRLAEGSGEGISLATAWKAVHAA